MRHQPASALARWFTARVAQNGGRFEEARDRRLGTQVTGRAVEVRDLTVS